MVKDLNNTYLSELVWREFFMQILWHFPKVVHENFRPKYNFIKWRNNEEEFEKWCKGETGYPLVDAGMRELNQTGFMHNRVRMVTAGFLCKHLLIDWRWGEAYFAKKLLDYELSSNNGNWQWSAGTGCDAAPYFRVFNPSEQIKKFDKQDMCGFTRRFVDNLESSFATEIEIDQDLDWSGVLCLGMGGSGAGGDFLKTLADHSGGIPFVVWKDYGIPSWWGSDWLVIATSYSGNTEETLDAVTNVLEQGGTVIGITSGGKLQEILSENDNSLCLNIPGGQMPRSAFGHLFGTQLSICWALGIFQRPSNDDIIDMLTRLRKLSSDADATGDNALTLSMAKSMLGKQIGIISPTLLSPAANRFANQLNENSERFARQVDLPEMNHNEIVAWGSADKKSHSDLSLIHI